MAESIPGKYVGAPRKRVEDIRLLTGRGTYVEDVFVENMAHAAFLRSPMAHGRIVSIDADAATRLPGVLGVLTGTDMQRLTNAFAGPLMFKGLVHPTFHALATDRVRHVGDPIAIVVATSRAVAEDACDVIYVEYEQLDPVPDSATALDDAAPEVWAQVPHNILRHVVEDDGDVDAAFGRADQVVRETFQMHRHSNQPMETRGIVAERHPRTGAFVIHSNTQNTHLLKWSLALMVNRLSWPAFLLVLLREPLRLKAFVGGAISYVRARPDLGGVAKVTMPIFLRHAAHDLRWLRELLRAFVNLIAAPASGIPEVRTRDIGGAFGSKSVVPREDVAVLVAAQQFSCSVKWIEDRNEHLTVGAQARDESVEIEMAIKDDGSILGAKVRLLLDAGAYPAYPFGAPVFARIAKTLFCGPYRIGAIRFDTTIVVSNKATYIAYRGPWAVETWVRERMIDIVARTVGRPAPGVRYANMYGIEDLPTKMITGPELDVRMSARTTLEHAMKYADVDGWPERQAAARNRGRLLGLGIATFLEPAPGPPGFLDFVAPGFTIMTGPEPAALRLEFDGSISVYTQQVPHGQGQETTLAQVAADQLGVPIESIEVRFGNTAVTPFNLLGTSGSRGAARAGGAVSFGAAELRRRIDALAADILGVPSSALVMDAGIITAIDVPGRSLTMRDLADAAVDRGLGDRSAALRVDQEWDCGPGGWAQATHACWVELDLETGAVTIPRYVVVEDSGVLINPAIVDGQIRGGVAQGIGAVFYERSVYDEDAQFQSGTFKDYLMPTSAEIPDFEIHHVQTPSDVPANFRGCGEGGMICSPAAITNAVEDALAHLGVRITEQHLPPWRVLELAGVIPTDTPRGAPISRVTVTQCAAADRGVQHWFSPGLHTAMGAAGRASASGWRTAKQLNRNIPPAIRRSVRGRLAVVGAGRLAR